MFERVDAAVEAVRAAVDAADPDGLDGRGAVRLLEAGTEIERLGGTLKLLAARRIDQTQTGRGEGDRSTAHFVARKTGTSVGQAVGTLQTARRIDPYGPTAEALKAGELSAQQAREITDAVAADPHAEKELLGSARTDSFQELREECRRVKAAACDDELAHHDTIRRSRFVRAWTDRDGAGRGEWKLTPEDHARVLARLATEANDVAAEAKAAGAPRESVEAYTADALVRLAERTGDEKRSGPGAVIHLRVDHAAFVRGNTEPGEICEVEGAGPVPVATARNLATDAVIHALVTRGTDVTQYVNLGRTIPSALERALQERDQVCGVPGCSVREPLEIHHRDPVGNDGETSLQNCCRVCRWHHYLCTHHGWQIEGHPGDWKFTPPSGRSPPDDLQLAV